LESRYNYFGPETPMTQEGSMKQMITSVVVAFMLIGTVLNLRHVTAQQPACLHGAE
jgi:hypothetical protein